MYDDEMPEIDSFIRKPVSRDEMIYFATADQSREIQSVFSSRRQSPVSGFIDDENFAFNDPRIGK